MKFFPHSLSILTRQICVRNLFIPQNALCIICAVCNAFPQLREIRKFLKLCVSLLIDRYVLHKKIKVFSKIGYVTFSR